MNPVPTILLEDSTREKICCLVLKKYSFHTLIFIHNITFIHMQLIYNIVHKYLNYVISTQTGRNSLSNRMLIVNLN